MRLSEESKKFIVTQYRVYNSYTSLSRKYRTQFKTKKVPDHKTVKAIIDKFEKTGSIEDLPRSGRPKSSTTEDKIEEVRELIENNLSVSIRRVHLSTGISVESVHHIASTLLDLHHTN